MKDGDKPFRTELREGETEVLGVGVDESGRCVSDIDDDDEEEEEEEDEIEGGQERVGMKRAEPTRRILLVKGKGDLVDLQDL